MKIRIWITLKHLSIHISNGPQFRLPIESFLYQHSPTYHYDKVMNKVSTAKNKPLSYNYIHVYQISNGFLYIIDNVIL